MAINFPASPSVNDTFTSGGITYTWDGTVWAASGSAAFLVAAEGIDALGDVDTSAVAPTDGQVLTWDNANSYWEPQDAASGTTDLSYTQSTRELASSTGTNVTLPLAGSSENQHGLMDRADKAKLDGIAAGAEVNEATDLSYTADTRELASSTGTNVTLPEVVASGDSGLMTGSDKSKLNGIEAGATADQTGAEIKTAYEGEADTNAFTDAEKTKLSGIATGAEVNVDTNLSYTASTRVLASSTGEDATLPEAVAAGNSGLMTGADKTKLDGIAAGAEVNVNADWNSSTGDSQILNKPTLGTAAATDSTDYATAAQGSTADSALQDITSESIGDLSDVDTTTTAPTDGQVLTWDNTNSKWEPGTISTTGATNLSYTASTRVLASSTGDDATLPEVVASGDSGLMTGADKSKLDGIAAGAEVNVDTDLSYTASTRVLASSTGTDATLPEVVAAGNSGLMTGADKTKLDGIAAGAEVNVDTDLSYDTSTRVLASSTGTNVSLPTAVASGDAGFMTGADKAKLDGIEANATADQTKTDIDALNINADQVDGLEASQFIRSDADDTCSGEITFSSGIKVTGSMSGDINSSEIVIESDKPRISFIDTTFGGDDFFLHVNNDSFYILRDSDQDGTVPGDQTPYPLQLNANNDTAFVFGHRILTVNDEGTGNGLDADTLDGQEGSYYLAYANFTGTPTLGTAAATDSTDYATAAQGATADSALQDLTGESIGSLSDVQISTAAAGEVLRYSGSNWVDAQLAYSDLSGTPTNVSDFTNDSGYITSADGGDADTVDTLHASQFIRSDANDTVDGATTWDYSSTGAIILNKATSTSYTGITFSEATDARYLLYVANTADGSLTLQKRKSGTSFVTAWSVAQSDGVTNFGPTPTVGGDAIWHSGSTMSTIRSELLAGSTADQVGSYAFLKKVNASSVQRNGTVSGSNLRYASAAGNSQNTPSGTWRCMGRSLDDGAQTAEKMTTLYVRLS